MIFFKVPIKAVAQGSHKAFIIKCRNGYNKAVITDNNQQSIHSERIAIAEEYHKAGGIDFGDRAVSVKAIFTFIRPKSVKATKRPFMTVKPDIDKIARCLIDGLTSHAFNDDSQVVELVCLKRYGDEDSIEIVVDEYHEPRAEFDENGNIVRVNGTLADRII